MMENRSFDNLFGRFPGANGTQVGVKFGKEVPLRRSPFWLPGDLPHDRAAFLNDVNDGTYDGFGNGQFGDPWSYTQFEEHQLPAYFGWAREYVLARFTRGPLMRRLRDSAPLGHRRALHSARPGR